MPKKIKVFQPEFTEDKIFKNRKNSNRKIQTSYGGSRYNNKSENANIGQLFHAFQNLTPNENIKK